MSTHWNLECVEQREGYNSNPEERKNTTQTQTWYIEKKGKRKITQIQKVKLQFHDFSNIEKLQRYLNPSQTKTFRGSEKSL